MTDVRAVGEFGLIERLRAQLGAPADARLLVGIGDDAAVWRADGGGYTLATTDTMVAGVHFLPDRAPWREVGWKALAVNISDIAAMGGDPQFALVTLMLPPSFVAASADELYAGLRECAEVYGVTVAGGDIVASETMAITIALTGSAADNSSGNAMLLVRGSASVGDVVVVTGALGQSAGGLRALTDGTDSDAARVLIEQHMHPWPRVDAGGIAVRAGIRCGMDISDGLLQDLGHICRASGVDAELRLADIPTTAELRQLYGDEARMMAATGGEDYELVLVGGEGAIAIAEGALRRHLKLPDEQQLIPVGRITGRGEGRVRLLDETGAEVTPPSGGWDHLSRGSA